MPTTEVSMFDYRKGAAAMFNVPETDVTPAMIARYKTATFSMRHSTGPVIFADLRAAERRVIGRLLPWPDCPDCKQSATGRYLGRAGCTRCGWTEAA